MLIQDFKQKNGKPDVIWKKREAKRMQPFIKLIYVYEILIVEISVNEYLE